MAAICSQDSNVVVEEITSSSSLEQSRWSKRRITSKPSWLLLLISDMEDKIQAINEEHKADSFVERADFYYRKRPELLALLQDLYNHYLYLADRYTRALAKQEPKKHEPNATELVISELVLKFVEYQIMVDELQSSEMIQEESRKKIELQKSLLEVLESERVILSNENSRLASESLFMKRKVGELARHVLLEKTEDERVCVLSRKIDDLQVRILELKKRNKEYYDKLMKQRMEANKNDEKKNISINITRLMVKNNGGGGSTISWSREDETGCSMSSTSNSSTCTSLASVMKGGKKKKKYFSRGNDGEQRYGLWDRVKKFDMFMCG